MRLNYWIGWQNPAIPPPTPQPTIGSSLHPVVCKRSGVLFTLFVFVCVKWCPTHNVLCFCSSCVPYVSRFSGLSNFHHTYSKGCPLGVLDLIEYGTVVNMDLVYKEYHPPKMWWISIEDQLIMVVSSPLHDIISYIGFRQVIQAHITCLYFIFPEPKAREIYNTDRLYEPVLHG